MNDTINYDEVYNSICHGNDVVALTHNGGGMSFKLFALTTSIIATTCDAYPLPCFTAGNACELEAECKLRDIYEIVPVTAQP